jgi:hypothetical protein
VSGQIVAIMFSVLTIQEVVTSRRLLDAYNGIVKCYQLCSNYIDRLLQLKTEISFLIYTNSKSRIISQDIITFTLNFFIHCTNQDDKNISSFTYVTDCELDIVIVANLNDGIILEDGTTRRVVELKKEICIAEKL